MKMFDFFIQSVFHVHSGVFLPAEEHPPPHRNDICGGDSWKMERTRHEIHTFATS